MSLLLVLFYFIGIPALVVAVALWLWRKTDSSLARGLVVVGSMVVLAGLLWLAQGEKWLADQQVRELCAKDGGGRVYETVKLTADKFDQYGQIRIPPKQDVKHGDEYYYESSMHYLKKGSPELWQLSFKVYRASDSKLLGEAISYARRGGDMPGPWHESSFGCPGDADITDLKKQIFIKD